jgi:anti-sigma factor ChrR (cupin superfamily)
VKHARLTDRLREQAALYRLGALPPDEHGAFARHLEHGCVPCRREAESFDGMEGLLALAAPAVAPPRTTRARVLTEARASTRPPSHFVLRREGAWNEIQPGVFRKDLDAAAGASYLIRLEPGARVHQHSHAATEHCYVVEGDIRIAGRRIHAGDFHLAEPGSTHDVASSEGGCLLLIVESH